MDDYEFDAVVRMAKKGKGTGPICKMFSGYVMIVLLAGLSSIFAAGLWLPAVIGLLIYLTSLPILLEVGIVVWVAYLGAWLPATIIAFATVLGTVSVYVGIAHARVTIRDQRATCGPFVGLGIMYLCHIALGGLLCALPWFKGTALLVIALLSVVVAVSQAAMMLSRLFPRWRRLEGPIMMYYAASAGEEMARATADRGRPFSVRRAVRDALYAAYEGYPGYMDGIADSIVFSVVKRGEEEVHETIRECALEVEERVLNYLLIRSCICEIVNHDLGPVEARRYWATVTSAFR